MTLATVLDAYTLSDLIELNDLTEEEVLEYLVDRGVIRLPELKPLEFD